MRMYRQYGYRLTYREIWRMADANALNFAVGALLKLFKAKAFETDLPHPDSLRRMTVDEIREDDRAKVTVHLDALERLGLKAQFVHHLALGSMRVYNIPCLSGDGRFYVTVALGLSSVNGMVIENLRTPAVSFLAGERVVITNNRPPQFDPAPYVASYRFHRKWDLAAIIAEHGATLDRLGGVERLTPEGLDARLLAYEAQSFAHMRARGIAGEPFEAPEPIPA
jgi:hypothetical protein